MINEISVGICDVSRDIQYQITFLIQEYVRYRAENVQVLSFSSVQELLSKPVQLSLLFLDITLGEVSEGEAVYAIQKQLPETIIVFVSDHSKYVIHSAALPIKRLLIAPFERQIFFEALEKIFAEYAQRQALYKITIDKTTLMTFPIYEILYIQASVNHLIIHAKDSIHQKRGWIKFEELRLKPYGFIRCHKNYLVNARYIKKIKLRDLALYLATSIEGDFLKVPIGKKECSNIEQDYQKWLLEQVD